MATNGGDSPVTAGGGLSSSDSPSVEAWEWDALAESSRNVFGTRQWLSTWQRHERERGEDVTLVTRRQDGTLAGLLVLSVTHRRPMVLRPRGPQPSTQDPVICANEDLDWVLRDLAQQLADRRDWHVLLLEDVPLGRPWGSGLRVVRSRQEASRVIELNGRTWDQLLASSNRSFRTDLLRRGRRLQERYQVRYRRAEDATCLKADIDRLLQLHWMRWGDEANLLTPARAPFLHDFAAQALELGWLELWFLELDGRAVAAYIGFRFAGTEAAFATGADPAFRQDHVGIAMIFHMVRQAADDGVREFRFLSGNQPYKARMPNSDRPVERLAISQGLVGQLALGALDLKLRGLELRHQLRTRIRPEAADVPAGQE